jgi:cell division protein FtsZ
MAEMGTAMMGTGEASGPNRAIDAAHGAITNPLLDIVSMKGAKGVLINITGGFDMTLYEVDAAANEIRAEVDPNANIILGSTFDEHMHGMMRVSIVATGIDDEAIVTMNTVVPPARKAADVYGGLQQRRPPALDQMPPPPALTPIAPGGAGFPEPRPSFARQKEEKGKGFNLFGWMTGAQEPAHQPHPPQPPAVIEHEPMHDDAPPNDEDLEIPAFLRRQMNPR